jgi:hypothetical protein
LALMPWPAFDAMFRFWVELLGDRGLPQRVRWVFYEDKARIPRPPLDPYPNAARFAFRPRPAVEAERIARFAYEHLDPKYPLAIVAYAVQDGSVITGFQGDLFMADDDIHRKDWNIYFDAREHIMDDSKMLIVSDDDAAWERRLAEQPYYLSELDYLVSVDALRRRFGYRD